MTPTNPFASIDPLRLDAVTGGATKSSGNQQLVTQMQQVTDALDDVKRASSKKSPMAELLPMMMMMKAMRG